MGCEPRGASHAEGRRRRAEGSKREGSVTMEDTDGDAPPSAVSLDEVGHDQQQRPRSLKQVPVTLITGFLGSGKTTLVRHILTEHHGHRIAVIMNEFGESVEGSYFHTPDGAKANLGEWVDLSNGCMCCAVKSEFVQAIESLMAKRDDFDHILIETTGLADPGPIAAALWTDDQLEAGVQLDSIVAVVDAINIDRQLHEPRAAGMVNEAQVQLAYADLILLNKMDMSGEEAVARAEADIRAVNSSVHIVRTRHCKVDLSIILNRNGYMAGADVALQTITEAEDVDEKEPDAALEKLSDLHISNLDDCAVCAASPSQRNSFSEDCMVPSRDLNRSLSKKRRKSGRGLTSLEHHRRHDIGIQTTTLRSLQPLNLEKFKSFMDQLLWDREVHPEDIYRVKGYLNVGGSDVKHMLQAVYELYNINETVQWGPKEVRQSVVVIIGRNLKVEQLRQWFSNCCLPDGGP